MIQRNLIREGFIFNTLNMSGAISGTQTVSPIELAALADENISSTALTISGGFVTVLDADLGARWKLNRIELYTNETSASNFSVNVSDNNLDFRPITMTGSSGLWVGDLPATTASGAPRYIRYRHAPASGVIVREWRAINDDSLIDFGQSGLETSLSIDDSPIGSVSEQIETLTIRNNYNRTAEGFVQIGRTFTEAEDEIEISVSPNGPWVGRNTSFSNQPSQIPWEQGVLSNTRVISSGVALFNFLNNSLNGWAATGATLSILDGKLHGVSSNQTPRTYISSEFISFVPKENYTTSTLRHANKFSFRAVDADTVRVRARVQTPLQLSNILEGARLFWKTEQNVETLPSDFRNNLSITSTAGTLLTGSFQDFIFPVSTSPTWSGTIRGLAFRPFTIVTGTNVVFDIAEIDVFNSNANHIALDFNPVPSGSFPLPLPYNDATITGSSRSIVSFRHTLTQDCIITKVGLFANPSSEPGIFLARRLPTSVFPNPGNNFTVPYGITFETTGQATSQNEYNTANVYWQGQRGDIFCTTNGGGQFDEGYCFVTGAPGDSFVSISGVSSINSISDLASSLNQNLFVSTNRNYLMFYEAIPTEQGGYKASGTYRSPVFDLGQVPALGNVDFDSILPVGTSIDSLGQAAFDSIRVRASDSPARQGLRLGETGVISGTNTTLGLLLNESAVINTTPANDQQINVVNTTVSVDENQFINNVAGAVAYHPDLDELWVLNCIISGMDPFVNTNARPTWDVYSPHTGQFIRTDHVKGDLTYGYDGTNGRSSGNVRGFLPVGFEIDTIRQEMYIFQKVPGFTIGAGEYYGLVLDMVGNLKDVFWRSGTLGFSPSSKEDILYQICALTYAQDLKDLSVAAADSTGVFFALHDDRFPLVSVEREVGRFITAFRNGNDVSSRNIGVINIKSVSSIPSLGFTASSQLCPTGLVYNKVDGLLYLHFDNVSGIYSGANKFPTFIALRPSFNTTSGQFDYTPTTISGTAFSTTPHITGLSRQFLGRGTSQNPLGQWQPIATRKPDVTMHITHNLLRDSFVILRSYFAEYSQLFPNSDAPSFVFEGPLNQVSTSLLFECGAGNRSSTVISAIPSSFDGLWGTVSGTLPFQDVVTEGVNFPTGRYVQVEYQLNSDPQQRLTPILLASKIAQGLRIGTIPANGTRDIYVRSNIPEGRTIGDQVGTLKVYWESEEN